MGTQPAGTALVERAREQWINSLIDVGGTNTLVFFKNTAATLDLGGADQAALGRLFAGAELAVEDLFPADATDALVRARKLRDKIRAWQEEKGIHVGYLALGMATWSDEGARVPAAPILLRPAHVRAISGNARRFQIRLDDGYEVNNALIFYLTRQLGAKFAEGAFDGLGLEEAAGDPSALAGEAARRLQAVARGVVPDFAVTDRTVLGLFNYRSLPMVRDIEANSALLSGNTVVRAISGDEQAREKIAHRAGPIDLSEPDRVRPQDEFLVLDADASQNHAINSVVSGHSVVIDGPPGTGKSQTIANLVATLIARGQRVLFVAEKRAAIDAVLGRLGQVGLRELVMDLHDGAPTKRSAADSLATAFGHLSSIRPIISSGYQFEPSRGRLVNHHAMLHQPRQPWGVTVFDAQQELIGLPSEARLPYRIPPATLAQLTEPVLAQATEQLQRYSALGGLTMTASDTRWFGASVTTASDAERAGTLAQQLAYTAMPELRDHLSKAADELTLAVPVTVRDCAGMIALIQRTANILRVLRPEIFSPALDDMAAATADRKWRKQNAVALSGGQRRRLRKAAQQLLLQPVAGSAALHSVLADAGDLASTWRGVTRDGARPRLPVNFDSLLAAWHRWGSGVTELGRYARFDTAGMSIADAEAGVRSLADDTETLYKLPHLSEALKALSEAGLGTFVQELRTHRVPDVAAALRHCWLSSILDQVRAQDSAFAGFNGATLHETVATYMRTDREQVATGAERVRARARENFAVACRQNDAQHALLKKEINKRSRRMPVRELLRLAPDVTLAATPCWAMSPLMVSQLLPAAELFDVVVFDEASQIRPAEAIPSIMRGRRVVVAGDPRQLPPTTFFASFADDEEDAEEITGPDSEAGPDLSVTKDFESILDTLSVLLERRQLTWHYRSRDERLIAFSNEYIYGRTLTTFPGTAEAPPLEFVHVTERGTAAIDSRSNSAEVAEVVRLVLEHARRHPDRTLGVITMGVQHAVRIEDALRRVQSTERTLESFFDSTRKDRFFVKSIESVQGDERDSIILSVGYAKNADGRMRYHFGAINRSGGERRLNVAVTRARLQITVVASFTPADMDPSRLTSRGPDLLRRYLQFAESGGLHLGDGPTGGIALNPFELDVQRRLEEAGIPLVAQYGASGYRIDFAARHPERPGEFVLAIEADGATYHSSSTARDRDRLRQEHLERLGWRFHRIWSTDWFRDPLTEVAKTKAAYAEAVARADRPTAEPAPPTADAGHADPVPEPAPTPTYAPARSTRKPKLLPPGTPIDQYRAANLAALVRWIESDGEIRTSEEIMREALRELGFNRLGAKIKAALENAIRDARRR